MDRSSAPWHLLTGPRHAVPWTAPPPPCICPLKAVAGLRRGARTGSCAANTTLSEVDNNLYYNPALGAAGTRQRPLFGSVGVPTMTLAEWQASPLTGIPNDRHSLVADPLFADRAAGNFSLRQGSPALGLGFEPIPAITAPSRRGR